MIKIGMFEAMLLIKAAWPDSTLLQSTVLEKAINNWYHLMTPTQRGQFYVSLQQFTKTNQKAFTTTQQILLSRYNPAKQVIVITKEGEYEAFMFQGRHHTHKLVHVNAQSIIRTDPNPKAINTN